MIRSKARIVRTAISLAAVLVSMSAIAQSPHDGGAETSTSAPSSMISLGDVSLLTTTIPQSKPSDDLIHGFGRIVPHPNALHDINANISGQIEEIMVRPGSIVKKDDPIAKVTSPDFIFTQRSYLTLLSNEERLEILREEGNLPNFMKSARDNLKWWGMSERQIDDLAANKKVIEQLEIVAPEDGVVTEILVQPGDVIDAGDKTMQKFIVLGRAVARMVESGHPPMLEAYAPADFVPVLRSDSVRVRFKSAKGEPLELPITIVTAEADSVTQMARVLVDLKDVGQDFKIGQSLSVDFVTPRSEGVWIPRAAVLRQEIKPVVFIKTADKSFERRELKVSEATRDWIRVSNVLLSEPVVTAGKSILEGAYRHQVGGIAESGHDDDHHHH